MKSNQKGFGLVVAILIALIAIVIAGTGWYVWDNNKEKNLEVKSTPQNNQTKQAEIEKDPTQDWATYSNAEGQYSFKYPGSWIVASNLDKCIDGMVLLAPTESALGKCPSESAGQIYVQSSLGDKRDNLSTEMSQAYYKDPLSSEVSINGVIGKKVTTTVSGMEKEIFVGSYPDNTKVVRYIFYANDRTYVATYVQEPSYPDVLDNFNTMVTKTFKFSKYIL